MRKEYCIDCGKPIKVSTFKSDFLCNRCKILKTHKKEMLMKISRPIS